MTAATLSAALGILLSSCLKLKVVRIKCLPKLTNSEGARLGLRVANGLSEPVFAGVVDLFNGAEGVTAPALETLELGTRSSFAFSDAFGHQLQRLKTLPLDCPRLAALPSSITALSDLEKLQWKIGSNPRCLPSLLLKGIPSLKSVRLTVPARLLPQASGLRGLDTLTSLEVLETTGSGSWDSPEVLGQLVMLRRLRVKRTNIHPQALYTGRGFSSLRRLRWLEVEGWPHMDLEDNLNGLINLRSLSLSTHEYLGHFPDSLSQLTNLRKIQMTGSKNLLSIPRGYLEQMRNLRSICMAGRGGEEVRLGALSSTMEKLQLLVHYCELPTNLPQLTNLTTLCMLPNAASPSTASQDEALLEAAAGKLVNLRSLSLNHQMVQRLPQAVSALRSLKDLEIRDDTGRLLRSLGYVDLPSLTSLLVDGTGTGTETLRLPRGITRFTSLRKLDIRKVDSGLRSFEWSALASLRSLSFDYCEVLSELPKGVSALTNLEELEVHSCENLRRLPRCLSHFPNLKKVDVAGCRELTWTLKGRKRRFKIE